MASAENLYNYLKTLKEPIYGIWGMQKNKLPDQFIKSFKKIFKKLVTVPIQNEPNALTAIELKNIGQKYMPTIQQKMLLPQLNKFLITKGKRSLSLDLLFAGDVLSKN
jgi:folylpolyglutamate synthase/dihydropteroate synthase